MNPLYLEPEHRLTDHELDTLIGTMQPMLKTDEELFQLNISQNPFFQHFLKNKDIAEEEKQKMLAEYRHEVMPVIQEKGRFFRSVVTKLAVLKVELQAVAEQGSIVRFIFPDRPCAENFLALYEASGEAEYKATFDAAVFEVLEDDMSVEQIKRAVKELPYATELEYIKEALVVHATRKPIE